MVTMVHCFACAVKHREDVMSLGSNAKRKVKVKCNTLMHQAIKKKIHCKVQCMVDPRSCHKHLNLLKADWLLTHDAFFFCEKTI